MLGLCCVHMHTPPSALSSMDIHHHKHLHKQTPLYLATCTHIFTPPYDTPYLYTHTYFLRTALHTSRQTQKHRPLHTYPLHTPHTCIYTYSYAQVYTKPITHSYKPTCTFTDRHLHTHVPVHPYTCTHLHTFRHVHPYTHVPQSPHIIAHTRL